MLTLLACAAFYGGAYAQSSTSSGSGVSQQSPQSDSKTPGSDIAAVRIGDGGYLGVYLGDVNEERAKELRLKEARGAVVGRIEEGSPAAKVGLLENDVILGFNDQRVQNRAHLYRLLIESQSGSKISLEISRRGVDQKLEVVLGRRRSAMLDERQSLFNEVNASLVAAEESRKLAEEALQKGDEKEARRFFEEEKLFHREAERMRLYIESQLREGKIRLTPPLRSGHNFNANRYQIGLSVTPLTEQLARFFNATKGGVLITEVRAGELGERHGLKAGDCIISVDGEAVKSASDLNRLVDQKSSGELEFVIVRDRAEQKIGIKLDQK
jgi:S1-C subfamily serine protease